MTRTKGDSKIVEPKYFSGNIQPEVNSVSNAPDTFSSNPSWQEFANIHHLSFIADELDNYGQVIGGYHGHHLTLSYTMGYTQILIFVNHSSKSYRAFKHKFPDQKQIMVEDVLNALLPASVLGTLRGIVDAGAGGQTITYRQRNFENDIRYLEFLFDLLCNLASAYRMIASMEGSAVPVLHPIAADNRHKLHPFAASLLRDIAARTTTQWGWQNSNLLCPQCLVYCGANHIQLSSLEAITYYGCRSCSQSQNFRKWKGQIIAVLDNLMAEEQVEQNNLLKINWLARRKLFDFNEVHLIRAVDENVERFAVQVGNDTDAIRKPRYQKMRCLISPDCRLSPNTMRILKHIFGRIEISRKA